MNSRLAGFANLFWLVTAIGIIVLVSCSNTQNANCPKKEALVVASKQSGPFLSTPGHVEAVCADGSGPLRFSLPSNADATWYLATSPDGRRMTVHLFEGRGNFPLYLADIPTSKLTRLLDIGSPSSSSRWSPDGKRLVLEGYFSSGSGIYVLDLSCLDQEKGCDKEPIYLTTGDSPTWSPDGNRIVFYDSERKNEKELPLHDIYVINADGSNRTRLTNDYQNVDPDWSPDGQSIAYQSWGKNHPRGIYLMKADGSNAVFLTEGEMPKWSPNGRRLAFVSNRNSSKEPLWTEGPSPNALYVIDIDTTNITRVSQEDNRFIHSFDWLPLNGD